MCQKESDELNGEGYLEENGLAKNRSDLVVEPIGSTGDDIESNCNSLQPARKLKYPKAIFFIFGNEFCERYSLFGMRTILSLYLVSHSGLGCDEQTATIIYHTFVMLCYFTPLIGGIVADSWLGMYKTILYVSIVYAFGDLLMAAGAFFGLGTFHRVLAFVGLLLIGLGTGGIKPCVATFGGDQFVLPDQKKQLDRFFSVFYFSVNAGAVISCFFSPMIRKLPCLGQDSCYPLAFGLPAILMVVSIIFFVCGKRAYRMKKPEGTSTTVEVSKCIVYAIRRKITSKQKKSHWLEYAEDKFSRKLIEETKVLIGICILFAPTIIFWSLYEQQGSKWIFQANRMDGRFGSSFVLLPDQMITFNGVLVLAFIPLFDYIIYPIFSKLHLIRTSLQKISCGGFVGACAFLLSGILQFYINTSNPVFPDPGQAQLRVYNNLNCSITLAPEINNLINDPIKTTAGPVTIPPYLDYMDLTIPTNNTKHIVASIGSSCPQFKNSTATIELNNEKVSTYLITSNASEYLELYALNTKGYKELDKNENGNPKIKLLYDIDVPVEVAFTLSDQSQKFYLESHYNGSEAHQTDWTTNVTTGIYGISVSGNKMDRKVNFEPGAVYMFMLINQTVSQTEQWDFKMFTLTPANNVSILWQVPQYVVITAAEILLSITGLEFSYNQSPDSMKSFVLALWLLSDSLGNLIVLIIEGIDIFENQAYTYFLFAGIMVVDMVIFVILAIRYKPPEFEFDENNRVVVKGTSTPRKDTPVEHSHKGR